jgi:hypothetical protein
MFEIVSVALIIAWICLALFKRTRPLTLIIVILWVTNVGMHSYLVHHDTAQIIGAVVIASGLVWYIVLNRKSYIDTIRGKDAPRPK